MKRARELPRSFQEKDYRDDDGNRYTLPINFYHVEHTPRRTFISPTPDTYSTNTTTYLEQMGKELQIKQEFKRIPSIQFYSIPREKRHTRIVAVDHLLTTSVAILLQEQGADPIVDTL
jgi:hypothetical protein